MIKDLEEVQQDDLHPVSGFAGVYSPEQSGSQTLHLGGRIHLQEHV